MTRYADPMVCPDCRQPLPADPTVCPACELPLDQPASVELFRTFQRADQLIEQLHASVVVAAVAEQASSHPEAASLPHHPGTATEAPRRRGLRAASVPKILLSLGALCLLVAAVIFLAVAWSWLGVGGRTAVLVGLTVAAGGLGVWLGGRGLRVAAESLTTVALGLVVLDVVGADQAGWFGSLDDAGTTIVVGGAVLVAALALLRFSAHLVAPQIVAALGLWAIAVGVGGLTDHDQIVATGAIVAFVALAAWGRVASLPTLVVSAALGSAFWWVALAGQGLEDGLTHATLREFWLEGHGVGLLVAGLFLLIPAIGGAHVFTVRISTGAAGLVITVALSLFAFDDGLTRFTVAALVALAVWALAAHRIRGEWALIPRIPLVAVSLPVLGVLVALIGEAIDRLESTGDPFTRAAGLRLPAADALAHPGLVIPASIGLLATAVLLLAVFLPAVGWHWLPPVGLAGIALAGVVTLALEPVPLWTVTVGLGVVGLGLVADGVRRAQPWAPGETTTGVLVGAMGLAAALASDWLTGAAALVLVVAAAGLLVTDRSAPQRMLGGALLPTATGVLLWSAGQVVDVQVADRVAPLLVVLGLLAIALPRIELEVPAALVALAAASAGYEATGGGQAWLALHLTLAGALVTTSALVHADRRILGWPGGLLLAAATWVRLAELGVEAPEAYTLPSAIALLLVGLVRLYRDAPASTAYALTPGLALATVPSLLWVLTQDPITLRAMLLGIGCLALILVGARLGWSAPLVVGALVGTLLALRELAPYLAETPQWILIGLAGTVLTVVGVTWERRVNDLQRAGLFLSRLR